MYLLEISDIELATERIRANNYEYGNEDVREFLTSLVKPSDSELTASS